MLGKLLIVNSYHPNARYVPMGAFGICDYLVQRGHQALIFNGALYPEAEQARRLDAEIRRFEPTVIGLIMQWKEYTESALHLARELKARCPDRPIIAGGMTAGYFAGPLLQRHRAIDGVIRGDAEESLHLVLSGKPWPEVPNLLQRVNGRVAGGNGPGCLTESADLDRISFAGLDSMVDHRRYLQAIEPVLGFPVFIGRGCRHRCQYCGGSRKAFVEHSGRRRPVYRSTAAVLRDLHLLSRWTKRIYIGFENSTRYLKKLFRLVAEDPELAGTLTLNYGSWSLPDRELLELYARAFRSGGRLKPILELSPETAIDADRLLIRDPSLYFSNRQLRETLETVNELFGSGLRVELYYSRYHHTQHSREKLEQELEGIHSLHRQLHHRRSGNVVVTNYHLATDVGSDNWDRMMEAAGGDGLDALLRGLARQRSPAAGHPPTDNLCLYTPPSLTPEEVAGHDLLVSWMELLRRQRPDCYFIAARALGFRCLVDCLRDVIEKRRLAGWGEEVSIQGLPHLLRALSRELDDQRHGVGAERKRLVQDLARLHAGHLGILAAPAGPDAASLIERPLLDETRLCRTGWELSAPDFLHELEASENLPPARPTLNVFCGLRVFGFPVRMEPWFRLFDGSRTVEEVAQGIGADGSLEAAEIKELLVFFTRFHTAFTC
jgi:hypothetical protein